MAQSLQKGLTFNYRRSSCSGNLNVELYYSPLP
jgi:hypothetical protein